MAVTASGLFVQTEIDRLDGTDLVIDIANDTIKVAMFTNSITPDFSNDTGYGASPYDANEVSGTGYTAGGATLASKTVTESPTGTLKIDSADVQWTTSTITDARCALAWDDTVTGDRALCLVDFEDDYSTTAGTFTIQWASGGIWTIDLTP